MSTAFSDLQTWLSDLVQRGRELLSSSNTLEGSSPQPAATKPAPASIACIEHVRYHVDIDERVDYSGFEVTGEVHVRVPCTAQYLPWYLNRRESGRPIACGSLHFQNCADAGLFDETVIRAHHGADLDFHLPVQVPSEALREHFASGDDLEGVFSYRPKMAREFPVAVTVSLSDAPPLGGERETTFRDGLRLQIEIQAGLSDLSQKMEKEVLTWVKDESRRVKQRYEGWRKVVDAIEDKKKADQDALRELGRATAPSLEEAQNEAARYGTLSRCIEQLCEEWRTAKGALLVRDLQESAVRARKEHPESDPTNRIVHDWLDELGRQLGQRQGPRFRYVGIEWPLPEPDGLWPGSGPFPGLGLWTYNPEAGRLEHREVKAEPPLESMRHRDRWRIDLPLQSPAGERQTVRGMVVVETDRLLSGLDVEWQPEEDDSEPQLTVTRASIIEISFQVDLSAVFAHRGFAVSRSLAFEGLLPSQMRVREVQDLLNDAGLTVLRSRRVERGDPIEVMATWRREGLPASFQAIVRGQSESAKHTLILDEARQQVERTITVGSLAIELRGQGAGDPRPIVDKIDEILLRLQERWGQGDVGVWQGTWYKEAR